MVHMLVLFIPFYRLPGNGEKAVIDVILEKRRVLHSEATTMALRLMLVSLFLLATAACSAYRKELDGNPPFTSHHYRYYDLDVVWQSERTDEGIRVTGKVTNRRDYYLRDLEPGGSSRQEYCSRFSYIHSTREDRTVSHGAPLISRGSAGMGPLHVCLLACRRTSEIQGIR